MRKAGLTGLGLGVLYVVVALATGGRPLFDGFAPPPPYRWVNPPREFRAGNQPPQPASIDVTLGPNGSATTSGSSEDGQVILSLGEGVFAGRAGTAKIVVHVTPVDPGTLAPPPAGLQADGNAYRLEFVAEPSKQPVTELAKPGDVFLVTPEPAQSLLFSPDGKAWEDLPARPAGDPTQIGGAFTRPGYLLAVVPPSARVPASASGRRSVAGVAGVTVVLVALLLGVPFGWRQLRGGDES